MDTLMLFRHADYATSQDKILHGEEGWTHYRSMRLRVNSSYDPHLSVPPLLCAKRLGCRNNKTQSASENLLLDEVGRPFRQKRHIQHITDFPLHALSTPTSLPLPALPTPPPSLLLPALPTPTCLLRSDDVEGLRSGGDGGVHLFAHFVRHNNAVPCTWNRQEGEHQHGLRIRHH